MKTVIEVFFVEIHEDLARWHCKRLALDAQGHAAQADLPGLACGMPQTPDQAVQALVQAWHADAGDGMPEYLAHSTSWRFEPPDTVVLSYVVCLPEAWQHRQGGVGISFGSTSVCVNCSLRRVRQPVRRARCG